jgi:ribokinase
MSQKKVLVFGSFVVDLTGRVNGLPLRGQTLLGNSFKMGAGGKGSNQAVAAHRAGADVTLVTKIGHDMLGQIALDFYQNEGMDTGNILVDDACSTGVALITVDEATAQNAIVVIPAASAHITTEDIEKCRPLIENAGILLLQMEINYDALYHIIDIACSAGVTIVLNPAPAAALPDEVLRKISIITPNETEVQILTNIKITNEEDACKASQVFLEKGVGNVIITMGAMGAFASDGMRHEMLPRLNMDVVDTTGAGDAFNGGFVTALSEGKDLFAALRYGNAAGALSVTKAGTAVSMPMRDEIEKVVRRYDVTQ